MREEEDFPPLVTPVADEGEFTSVSFAISSTLFASADFRPKGVARGFNGEPARVDTQMTHRKLSFVESWHDINMDRYGEWTVIKLKNELRSRGAVTTGRKTDLIER